MRLYAIKLCQFKTKRQDKYVCRKYWWQRTEPRNDNEENMKKLATELFHDEP
jgi:hypothetical protein